MPDDFDAPAFLDQIDWRDLALNLSQWLMEDAFFIKDRRGRFVMQNRRACDYCDAATEAETLGKTDADYFPEERAAGYVEGDRMVMRSDRPILHQISPAPEDRGSEGLIIYSKFPVHDATGQVIGVAGLHRRIDEGKASATVFGDIYPAVRAIQRHFARSLRMSDLASLCGLSHSQFNRRFRALLGMSPKDYLTRFRVKTACRMLESTRHSVARIAQDCGFYDHSHFSHAFRRVTGLSPTRFRSEHRAGSARPT
jgi:AraC-like DNA-binding protein